MAIDILRASVGNRGPAAPATSADALRIAAHDALAAVIYMVTLAALYKFTHKYAVIVLVISGAIAGQFLFVS